MTLFKKSLACLIAAATAVSMTLTSLTLTAFAADGDLYGTWSASNERTEGDAYIEAVPEERGMFDLRGDAAGNLNEAGDIVLTPDLFLVRNPVWGCEMTKLPPDRSYTIRVTVKLQDDPLVTNDDFAVVAVSPIIRGQDVGAPAEWLTLKDLRAKAAKADENGYFYLWCAVTPERYGYVADGSAINIESRLSAPMDALDQVDDFVYEYLADTNFELDVHEIAVFEGNIVPADEPSEGGTTPGGTPGGTTPGGTTPGGTTGGGTTPGGTTPSTPDKPSTPSVTTPKNGTAKVDGKLTLFKDSKKVIGTKAVKVGKSTYAVKGGVVQASKKGLKLVKLGKKSYIVNNKGVVQLAKKGKLVTVGKKRYVVNAKGVVQKATKKYTVVKVGKTKYIVNKSGVVQVKKKSIKVGKTTYKTNAKGVAKKK